MIGLQQLATARQERLARDARTNEIADDLANFHVARGICPSG
jgi:hypothetical protein